MLFRSANKDTHRPRVLPYRGTSLIRNSPPLGTYSSMKGPGSVHALSCPGWHELCLRPGPVLARPSLKGIHCGLAGFNPYQRLFSLDGARERVCVCVCVSERQCVREREEETEKKRERERVRERESEEEREKKRECVCVCEREKKKRERESVCV